MLVSFGSQPRRAEEHRLGAGRYQDPPRSTRVVPHSGPAGSMPTAESYGPYQSQHHSQTFPCMSWRPNGLAGQCPTGWTESRAFSWNQAC